MRHSKVREYTVSHRKNLESNRQPTHEPSLDHGGLEVPGKHPEVWFGPMVVQWLIQIVTRVTVRPELSRQRASH